MPGDHQRDISWRVSDITDSASSLFKTVEYSAAICYGGKTYVRRAFPFGAMKIGGDRIENDIGPEAVAGKMNAALEQSVAGRNSAVEKNALSRALVPAILTIALLALSVIISLFVHVTALVVVFFVLAAAAFIGNLLFMKKAETEAYSKAAMENQSERARIAGEISDYEKNFRKKQREALDQKLAALGLAPAAAGEL